MPFDVNKFQSADLSPRTAAVPVPGLAAWFGEGDDCRITVRGLTFEQIARAEEASNKHGTLIALVESLAADDNAKGKAQSILNALGYGEGTPAVVVKRLEMLKMGCVDPELPLEAVVKLSNAHPIEFKQLTDKVLELTGLGQVPGKQQGSGQEETSETA